jgi:exopolyphosphatase/guanosine-5'-triphosphate,3'-diphosphate pyrophosphatase
MALRAVIDLGTNTFQLLIAEMVPFRRIRTEKWMTRLGEGFSTAKRLRPAAMERAMTALHYFKEVLSQYPIAQPIVVGTSAIREAENRADFLLEVKRSCGFEVEVLSGEEEARCTFLGVNQIVRHSNGMMLVIDIGGGSTELIVAEGAAPKRLFSLPMGVVHFTERYLPAHQASPTPQSRAAISEAVDAALAPILEDLPRGCRFAGTAGTLTTLAAMDQNMSDYVPEKVNGYSLSAAAIARIYALLSLLPPEQRLRVPGLESGREEIILAGILILLRVMKQVGCSHVSVSDYGLREGVLLRDPQTPLRYAETVT